MECCAPCIGCGDTIEPGEQAHVILNRRKGAFFVCAICEEACNRKGLRLEAQLRAWRRHELTAYEIMDLLINGWGQDCERVTINVPPLMELTREVLT